MANKSGRTAVLPLSSLAHGLLWLVQILMAAFFGFVGYMKAFAPMRDLDGYHAWVASLPPMLARAVGWSEMLCAAGLILPGLLRRREHLIGLSALILALNQLVAIRFHELRQELAHSLLQNVVLIALLLSIWWGRRQGRFQAVLRGPWRDIR